MSAPATDDAQIPPAGTTQTAATPAGAAAAAPAAEGTDAPAGPSKSELKKRAKEAEKAKKAEAARLRAEEEKKAREAKEAEDHAKQNYGKLPLHQSQSRDGQKRLKFQELNDDLVNQRVLFRARLHNSRSQSAKLAFVTLRQQTHTLQGLVAVSKDDDPNQVSRQMVKYATLIPSESLVLVEGIVAKADVKSCTVNNYEVKIHKIFTSVEVGDLPFSIDDASRPESDFARMETEDVQFSRVALPTRLDNRTLDLRTPTNQAIFRIQSAVGTFFRSYLTSQNFIEIHTPKLQGAATESGASVFKVQYFNGGAFLAQSPQLAKQMAIAGDLERVFEIGPVFRAEDSNTHRHMTEFMGLDLEMAIEEHYHEAVDVLDNMLKHIFKGLQTEFKHEIEVVKKQHPHEDFLFLEETLRLPFKEGMKLLKEAGATNSDGSPIGEMDDMSTENEKLLGRIIREKYHTDYFILDKFPLAIRPFYTMPDPTDPTLSNSYDFFMRGEEILSGAQRVHDADVLAERMKEVGIDPATMGSYLDAFRLGAPPHAGGGIGLERVVMLFLKLGNIRRASLFPRDPKRLAP
ncbi:aspartate-tRNA(Asn) ligase [Cryptococcus amylolentus CBS 6039]|uniref:Aspartate--tRNA ligase, cytoplasmic n=2 Tax=Cryptococcus amylolentus TaxID=104669 RepID=A0A1E3HDA6_9TREE|nr:aspartate-tRNA(Asn) ligase [Cryptococcus amylolentus CBS 6039]ODN74330.1 aspartate-tRNA(Asn) ligase [Cryptococcus amylolentus CBS 6039]ODO01353.1 aspartate-tRNA(Asn) ligase [Cryptococcus amylolentus CBS 6273]